MRLPPRSRSPAALILAGCGTGPPDPVLDDSVRGRLYDRADGAFAWAGLLKPSAGREGRFVDLAPLLMQEVVDGDEAAPAWPLRPDVEAGRPTVFFERTEAVSEREIPEQWAYLWWYPPRRGSQGGFQGVRLTLDPDGFPATVEVLRDSSGAWPVFVASGLEASASGARPAAAGRRFSIEPPLERAPRLVVPSLLDPGPVPLGPFVYLARETHDVAMMICRCSPSRVDAVIEAAEYDLVPLTELRDGGIRIPSWPAAAEASALRAAVGRPAG